MKHIFLIKQSMVGNVDELTNRIYTECENLNYDYVIVQVGTDEDIQEVARRFKNKDYIVYAVGDDKDINLVLNEIALGKAKLGIIPIGEDNDFYRSLDEYQSEQVNTNVMMVNELYVLNNFNLGINAEIYKNMEKIKQLHMLSKSLYPLSLLYTIYKFQGQVVGINDFFEKYALVSISNGVYFGGGYPIAPRASIHRGEVSVVTLSDEIPRAMIPRFWLEIANRNHKNNPYVSLYIGDKEIHIETMNELSGQLDGRMINGSDFKVIPNAGKIEVVNNRKLIRNLRK